MTVRRSFLMIKEKTYKARWKAMLDILIVEDNKEIGSLLCDFLRKENYTVSVAETGEGPFLVGEVWCQINCFGYYASGNGWFCPLFQKSERLPIPTF